jgi:hypothetical protein
MIFIVKDCIYWDVVHYVRKLRATVERFRDPQRETIPSQVYFYYADYETVGISLTTPLHTRADSST